MFVVMALPVLEGGAFVVDGLVASGISDRQPVQLTRHGIEQLNRFPRRERSRIAPSGRGRLLTGGLTGLARDDAGTVRRRLLLLVCWRLLPGALVRSAFLVALRAGLVRGRLTRPILLGLAVLRTL
jgi:hypothetical protein